MGYDASRRRAQLDPAVLKPFAVEAFAYAESRSICTLVCSSTPARIRSSQ